MHKYISEPLIFLKKVVAARCPIQNKDNQE